MKPKTTIDVGEKFSDMPFGRDDKDGDFNGLRFRKNFLLPALSEYEHVEIDLTNVLGCPSSFTDEAFAGLVIYEGFSKEEVNRRLSFVTEYQSIKKNIAKYISEAKPRET
ncbi:STAS-like domain-containing protein [Pseudomonas qingdaonensis]|uniref:STAS-like domain-containing protein n=1 Tax=Pseudomonas qingdaonensis TaxID=2056231 RepID=UPI0028AE6338|nr:STAS-like domain-containing protein [Pseudomonas qingdaonensis]